MPENNLRQADVPKGGEPIPNPIGTAPGLRLRWTGGDKVVYAVPGVPYEMTAWSPSTCSPTCSRARASKAAIVSRSLKTWGTSESGLAEMIAHRVDAQTNPTIAFLARGIEGLYVRMTAKAATEDEARDLLDAEDRELRAMLGELVFGVDDETMESAASSTCGSGAGRSGSRSRSPAGSSVHASPTCRARATCRGGVVAYTPTTKRDLLGVTAEQVVSGEAATRLAEAASARRRRRRRPRDRRRRARRAWTGQPVGTEAVAARRRRPRAAEAVGTAARPARPAPARVATSIGQPADDEAAPVAGEPELTRSRRTS